MPVPEVILSLARNATTILNHKTAPLCATQNPKSVLGPKRSLSAFDPFRSLAVPDRMDCIRERHWRALQGISEKRSSNTLTGVRDAGRVREGRRNSASERWNHLVSRIARIDRAVRLFDAIRTGTLSVLAIERFPLRDGTAAHARLEGRDFSGTIDMTGDE
jgi:hypothetical protein